MAVLTFISDVDTLVCSFTYLSTFLALFIWYMNVCLAPKYTQVRQALVVRLWVLQVLYQALFWSFAVW
jgi:hypothetical protein